MDQVLEKRGLDTIAPVPGQTQPPPRRFALSPINRRRLDNFKANRRGYYSFWIFLVAFRPVALRRVHRQRSADRDLLQGRDPLAGLPRLSRKRSSAGSWPRPTTATRSSRTRSCAQWLDAVAADPLLVPHASTTRSGAGAGAAVVDGDQGGALRRAIRTASTTGTAPSATGTGSAPTTRAATWWRA